MFLTYSRKPSNTRRTARKYVYVWCDQHAIKSWNNSRGRWWMETAIRRLSTEQWNGLIDSSLDSVKRQKILLTLFLSPSLLCWISRLDDILPLFCPWGSWSEITCLTWLFLLHGEGWPFAVPCIGVCWRDLTEFTSHWIIPDDIHKGHCEEVGSYEKLQRVGSCLQFMNVE